MSVSKELKILRVKHGQNCKKTMRQVMIIKRLKKDRK